MLSYLLRREPRASLCQSSLAKTQTETRKTSLEIDLVDIRKSTNYAHCLTDKFSFVFLTKVSGLES